jgi:hypothetical protein
MRNKRASLELSIRAIVIVILAMTLLGLGLGFIRGMFKDIGGITEDVSEQIRQQILDDLITNDKSLSFPKIEIVIDRGDSEILTVGLRNKRNTPLNYKMIFTAISGPSGPLAPDAYEEWFQYSTAVATLLPADATVRSIRLDVPNIDTGSYFFTFDVVDDDAAPGDDNYIYAQKDFFIVVR